MDEIIRKQFTGTIKAIDQVMQTLTMVVSDESEDREGDIIEAAGWQLENYRKNPVVLFAHDYTAPAVAKALDIHVQGSELIATLQFAPIPFAQELWLLYSQGFMRASSVGFIPKRYEEREESSRHSFWGNPRTYKEQELLEFSLVPVPANPNALVSLMAKAIRSNWMPVQRPYENEHACRLEDPDKYDTCRRGERTADKPDAVKGKKFYVVYCKKGDGPMEQQAFRYPKDDWTVAQARSHCEYSEGSFEPAQGESAVSQGLIGDELDYLKDILTDASGLTENLKPLARDVLTLLQALSGGDIPETIDKVGAVLNRKNKEALEQARDLVQQVLDSAEPQGEPQDESLDAATIAALVGEVFESKIRRMR